MPETVTYRQAITWALRDAMRADERVLLLGEGIGSAGESAPSTAGLRDEFGSRRVMATPVSETGFVGVSIGLALAGFRPVAELQFADFAALAWEQIVSEAAPYWDLSSGQIVVPLVIRAPSGGLGCGAPHAPTTKSWYLSVPGLKVVAPATPQDAYGLLISAIADPTPVVYLEHEKLLDVTGPLDTARGPIPIGRAAILRSGKDVTLAATLAMVTVALEAAELLAGEGIDAEVIDLRSLQPLDVATVTDSVRRTGRLVTVEEQPVPGGWGGEIVAEVVSRVFDYLDAPPVRVGIPLPPPAFSPPLEDAALPPPERVAAAVHSTR